MARRKQEIALQIDIETQEDWEDNLSKDGILVVDVYQEWAGPCVGMVSNLKRLKNEVGDDLLRFAVAKSDTIESLERYRGKCEPCFLIYAGGTLVYHLAGARAPALCKAITDELTQEHRVIAGEAERKAIRDPMMDEKPEKAALDAEENEKDEVVEKEKEVTVCLIKPDAVQAGKVDEIIEQLTSRGIEILKQEERQLTDEEAREFYSAQIEEEYFEDLIKFMCSGPSQVLVLSKGTLGENIIAEFRDLLGPKQVEEAKENAPESLRALYGTTSMTNAVHGACDKHDAMRELAFFFPDYVVPTVTTKKPKVQRTLALIRPDALRDHKDDIIAKIEQSGFKIAFQKEIQLSKEQAEDFYKEHTGQEYFEELTTRMSSGPLLALALAREEAVDGWRDMLGPKEVPKAKEEAPDSLRAQFSVGEDVINPLHGSDTLEHAEEELGYFFPIEQTVAVVKPDAYQTKDEIIQRIHEAGFRIAARKEAQLTKEVAEQLYEDNKDKDYYNDLTDHMCSGNTLFLVLSRQNAVEGWRSMIGPTDPEQAKEQAPHSLRAEFGADIKQNAVHGSSNPEHAHKAISLIFGDMEFNKDGTVKGSAPELDEAVLERDPDADAEQTQEGEATTGEEEAKKEVEGDAEVKEGAESEAKEGEQTESAVKEGDKTAAEGDKTEAAEVKAVEGDAEAPAEPTEGTAPAEGEGETKNEEGETADQKEAPTGSDTVKAADEGGDASKEGEVAPKEASKDGTEGGEAKDEPAKGSETEPDKSKKDSEPEAETKAGEETEAKTKEESGVKGEKETETKDKTEPEPKKEEPDVKVEKSEAKPEEPEAKSEEPEAKPKEPEAKPKEPEAKPKEPEAKPEEPEAKPEEPEAKPKEPEAKPEEPEESEAKPEEPEAKPDAEPEAKTDPEPAKDAAEEQTKDVVEEPVKEAAPEEAAEHKKEDAAPAAGEEAVAEVTPAAAAETAPDEQKADDSAKNADDEQAAQ